MKLPAAGGACRRGDWRRFGDELLRRCPAGEALPRCAESASFRLALARLRWREVGDTRCWRSSTTSPASSKRREVVGLAPAGAPALQPTFKACRSPGGCTRHWWRRVVLARIVAFSSAHQRCLLVRTTAVSSDTGSIWHDAADGFHQVRPRAPFLRQQCSARQRLEASRPSLHQVRRDRRQFIAGVAEGCFTARAAPRPSRVRPSRTKSAVARIAPSAAPGCVPRAGCGLARGRKRIWPGRKTRLPCLRSFVVAPAAESAGRSAAAGRRW